MGSLLRNSKGQGAVEYILLLVVVVALTVVFKDKLKVNKYDNNYDYQPYPDQQGFGPNGPE